MVQNASDVLLSYSDSGWGAALCVVVMSCGGRCTANLEAGHLWDGWVLELDTRKLL